MSKVLGKYRAGLFFLILLAGFSGTTTWCSAEEVLPLRLVALLDRDDQGDRIEFPIALHYDHWSSETYLISSTGRITIYDQKYFPVASFGKGRGLTAPSGITVDRRGRIYVCQEADGSVHKPRLTIFNQAFFPSKEIVFANIPEIAEFTASRVAVAESGEIYLTGHNGPVQLGFVVVLTPEGKFSRFLYTPENNAWRPLTKDEAVADKIAKGASTSVNSEAVAAETVSIPAGLKPKSRSISQEEPDEPGRMGPAYIDDVKIDRQGRIYLLSREVSNIYVLNAKEEYLFKFGEKGGVHGKLSNPVSLSIDLERQTIYVCDYMRHTILSYDYDTGRFVFEFGGRGLGPLWFNFPNNVEVDQRGQVVIADLFNRRLQVIDPNMDQRRPLVARLPSQLAPGTKPAKEESQVGMVLPQPAVSVPLAEISQVHLPLAVAALPPPSPPDQAEPLFQEPVIALGIVIPPVFPEEVVAVPEEVVAVSDVEDLPLPPTELVVPSIRTSQLPLRELTPRLVKKMILPSTPPLKIVSSSPQLKIIEFASVLSPERFSRPGAVHFPPEQVARPARLPLDFSDLGLQTFRSMPAAIGVYGPVVSMFGVGSWLLSTNR